MTIAPSQGSPRPPAGERGEREGEGGGRRGAPSPGSRTPGACPPISRPAPQPSARVLPFPAPPRPALWHRRVGVRGGADPRSPARKEGGWDGRQWGRGGGGGGVASPGGGLFPPTPPTPAPAPPFPPGSRAASSCRFIAQPQPQPPQPAQPAAATGQKAAPAGPPLRPPLPAPAAASEIYYHHHDVYHLS